MVKPLWLAKHLHFHVFIYCLPFCQVIHNLSWRLPVFLEQNKKGGDGSSVLILNSHQSLWDLGLAGTDDVKGNIWNIRFAYTAQYLLLMLFYYTYQTPWQGTAQGSVPTPSSVLCHSSTASWCTDRLVQPHSDRWTVQRNKYRHVGLKQEEIQYHD